MDIGNIIKTYRTKCGMSQEKLAERLQLSKSAIANYESGFRLPDFETIKKAKSILDIPASVLMEEKEMKHKHKPFFTKEDFVRFIAMWEEGFDVSTEDLVQEGDKWIYRVYAKTPYYFELSNGHINWIRSEWDETFIERFYMNLSYLATKKRLEKPRLFEVTYNNLQGGSWKDITHIITGYEDDTLEELFMLAAVKARCNDEDSLWCNLCSDFKCRVLDSPEEKSI